jgi:fructose-1,6-bisphosphatase
MNSVHQVKIMYLVFGTYRIKPKPTHVKGYINNISKSEIKTYIHTYHLRFIPEMVAEVSQIFLRDTHVLPKLVSYEEHCKRDRW